MTVSKTLQVVPKTVAVPVTKQQGSMAAGLLGKVKQRTSTAPVRTPGALLQVIK